MPKTQPGSALFQHLIWNPTCHQLKISYPAIWSPAGSKGLVSGIWHLWSDPIKSGAGSGGLGLHFWRHCIVLLISEGPFIDSYRLAARVDHNFQFQNVEQLLILRYTNRAPIGSNKANVVRRCFVFLFFNVLYWYLGVLIIPKWLIKVPGPIAIFFRWFGELRTFCQIWTRRPPNYYQHASTNIRKYGNILETYFHIWESEKMFFFESSWKS